MKYKQHVYNFGIGTRCMLHTLQGVLQYECTPNPNMVVLKSYRQKWGGGGESLSSFKFVQVKIICNAGLFRKSRFFLYFFSIQ